MLFTSNVIFISKNPLIPFNTISIFSLMTICFSHAFFLLVPVLGILFSPPDSYRTAIHPHGLLCISKSQEPTVLISIIHKGSSGSKSLNQATSLRHQERACKKTNPSIYKSMSGDEGLYVSPTHSFWNLAPLTVWPKLVG